MPAAMDALASGARPDPTTVEISRKEIVRIDSDLALKTQIIASLPNPPGMDACLCEAAKVTMLAEAKRIAEKEKERYKSIIKLDEMYRMFDNAVKNSATEIVEEPKNESMVMSESNAISKNGSLRLNCNELTHDLRGLFIHNVPDYTHKLSAIAKLDISNNNMKSLPESVTSLENLRILDVHSNQLTSLPPSMGRLTKLRTLDLSGNLFTDFPLSVQDCSFLEELIADFNQLKCLPQTLGFGLVQLRKLSLRSNKICFLPSSISHMTSLRILDLHMNKLSYLAHDIDNLIHLQLLNASCNFSCLQTLPDSIGGLISLIELDVSYNQIKEIPRSVASLEVLELLNLEGNPLITPPISVAKEGVHAVKEYLMKRGSKTCLRRSLPCLMSRRGWPGCKIIYKSIVSGQDKAMTWQSCASDDEEERGSSSRCFFTPSRSSSTPPRTPHHLYSPLNS